MRQALIYFLIINIFFLTSCKENYEPPVIKTDLNYLVVDGALINGQDSTIIRLSRTQKLEVNPQIFGEQGAQITVEDMQGTTLYNLIPINDNGEYGLAAMSLDLNSTYRLRIITTDGNQYVSDNIAVKQTPPIDSVSWQLTPDGVTFYVNSHDPQNNTKYYRWGYSETWEYHSSYYATIKYVPSGSNIDEMFPPRAPDELVYNCWRTAGSNEILLGTTAKLSADVVSLMPVRFIPVNSVELNAEYSIQVKQYALAKDAFEYFENIKKISEQQGSLFDAQPSQLAGNIHNVAKPNEPVIGFVTASSLQQKRLFITNDQVAPWHYFTYCPDKQKVPLDLDSLSYYFGGYVPLLTPVEDVYDPMFTGINGALPFCADCTLQGGSNIKPDFWP